MYASVNLVCPGCDAVNRVASARAHEETLCSRCRAELFPDASVSLDDPIRFQKHIISHDAPVLVAFWAPWCGPCRIMAEEFEEAARRLKWDLRLAKVNTDRAGEVAARHQVQAIPTMILFHRGGEIGRFQGSITAAGIARFAQDHLTAALETPFAPEALPIASPAL